MWSRGPEKKRCKYSVCVCVDGKSMRMILILFSTVSFFFTVQKSDFMTGEEELMGLPSDVQEMFVLVPEEEFRMDISSTELRAQAK